MRLPPSLVAFLIATSLSAPAAGYEGQVRREVDAGVHLPVLTAPPELLQFVPATHPEEALRLGLTATVRLQVTVGADGTVTDTQVVAVEGLDLPTRDGGAASVGDAGAPASGLERAFADAALEAVYRFQFKPAEVDHVPAPVQLEYLYHFTQREEPVAPPKAEREPTPATLKGQVVARGSRTRVEGATVRCGDEAEAAEALSDSEGRFSLQVPPGECQVRALASGFQLFKTTEKLAPGETAEVMYHLVPQAIGFETVVRAKRDKVEVVRRTVERQEMQRVPGSLGDPLRVLQNFPGVARLPFAAGQLIIRGAPPDQTLTFMDGVEVPLLFHLGGGPSVINSEFLDRVDFYPGGFGARYGRAVGGIVDVATRKGAKDTLHGSVKIDLLDTGVFLEAPITDGVSVAGAARRSYVDALLPLVLPQDPEGGTLLILPVYWDYQVRVDFGKPSQDPALPSSTGYVMAFGSDDLLKVVATGGGRNRDLTISTHTLFHRLKGDWTYRYGALTSVLTPYVGYDLGTFSIGESNVRADIFNLGLREDLALEVLPWLTVRAGADILFQHLKGFGQFPSISGIEYPAWPGANPKAELAVYRETLNSFDGALYFEADFKLGKVTLTPGVRGSRARIAGEDLGAFDPRLWVRYQLLESTQLKGSVGLYTQPPESTDMVDPPLGNPKLGHEKAFQTSIGIAHKFTDVVSADLTGYFNRRYELVAASPRTLGNFARVDNRGLGRSYGLEVLLRHQMTKNFFGWIAYTLNRSEDRVEGEDAYELTTFDQTHILTAVGSYRLPYGFEVGARFRYVTGRPSTPLLHPYDRYGVDANRYYGTYGAERSSRFPAFHQLDVRIDKSFLFKSWTLDLYLDVQNVYNAQNVEAVLTDYRLREEVPVPGIPILPVLGVKATF